MAEMQEQAPIEEIEPNEGESASADEDERDSTRDPKLLTPEQVERIVQERLARDRRDRKSKREPDKPKPRSEPETTLTRKEMYEELQTLRTQRDFDRAVGGLPLNDTQRDALETLFMSARPEDPRAWVGEQVKALGWSNGSTSNDKAQDAPPETTPTPDRGGPSPAARWQDRALAPNEWTREDIGRILNEKGAAAGRRYIRENVEAWLKGVRVVPPK